MSTAKLRFTHKLRSTTVPLTFTEDMLKKIKKLKIEEDDVFVIGYPKSGNNWLKYLVSLMFEDGKLNLVDDDWKYFPLLEMGYVYNGMDIFKRLERPRRAWSHCPVNMVPDAFFTENRGKVIYIARNPKDVIVSGFSFFKNFVVLGMPLFQKGFDDYINMFMKGGSLYGDWLKHVSGWWEMRHNPNVMFLFYEEMIADPLKMTRKIAEFLGHDFDDKKLMDIVERSRFDKMKQDRDGKHLTTTLLPAFKDLNFFRKGEVGDWKNHFSQTQSEHIDEMLVEKVAALGINFNCVLNENQETD